MKKMAIWEKLMEVVALILLIIATIIKSQMGVEKTGYLVMLAFLGIMVYVIFLVAAFFPANWRLTERERAMIEDKEQYQVNYRKTWVCINFAFSIFFCWVILFGLK